MRFKHRYTIKKKHHRTSQSGGVNDFWKKLSITFEENLVLFECMLLLFSYRVKKRSTSVTDCYVLEKITKTKRYFSLISMRYSFSRFLSRSIVFRQSEVFTEIKYCSLTALNPIRPKQFNVLRY